MIIRPTKRDLRKNLLKPSKLIMKYIRYRKPAKDPLRQIDDGGLKVVLEEEKATAEKLNGLSAPVLTTGELKEVATREPFLTGASPKHCLKLKWQ